MLNVFNARNVYEEDIMAATPERFDASATLLSKLFYDWMENPMQQGSFLRNFLVSGL